MKDILRADVDGLTIAYRRAGDGPALVLLHGFLLDSRIWRPQLDTLAADFTAIAWDAPGAGESADPPDTFTTADWADSLAGLLDVVGVGVAHVVGLSWGGIVAQELYRRHPARVRSLVLAGTYAGWKGSLREDVCAERLRTCLRDSSLPPDDLVRKYLPSMFGKTASDDVHLELSAVMADFHPLGFRLMAISSAESDTRELLPRIDVPTLLLWGDGDLRSPLSVARQFSEAIPGAQLAVIPEAGHVSNLEAPERFNAEVGAFYRSVTGS
jgi:pimeloyl-ACP methyl ester carboxylesterase